MRHLRPSARRFARPTLESLEARLAPIVGPIPAPNTSAALPFQAPLRPEVVRVDFHNTDNGKYYSNGTGTFITRQHILTAAHVVDSNDDFEFTSADFPIYITTGQGANVSVNGKSYRAAAVHIHPGYYEQRTSQGKFLAAYNDVAVIQLETMVEDITPVPLYRSSLRSDDDYADELEILGFGQTGIRNGALQDNGAIRYAGAIMIEELSKDGKTFTWDYDQVNEGNTAPGDSGGPSLIYPPGQSARIAGVHSYGHTAATRPGARSTDMRVDYYAPWIDSLTLNTSTGPTVEVLNVSNITDPNGPVTTIRLRYSDINGISEANLQNPHIALTGPNNYYNQYPTLGLVIRSTDGNYLTVEYRFAGPGGVWRAADNGTYRVTLLNRGLTDNNGNPTGVSNVASLTVNVPADSSPPTADFPSFASASRGKPNYVALVRYRDTAGIDARTLGNDDVRLVKVGGGYNVGGRLMIGSARRNATALTMLYEFAAPGGSWDAADNGTYRVVVQGGSVRDVGGNAIAATTVHEFTVNLTASSPVPPYATLNAADITSATNTITFSITYTDDSGVSVASVQNDMQEVLLSGSNLIDDFATLVSVTPSSNSTSVTATYRYQRRNWTEAHNGHDFKVYILSGGISGIVTDTSGNEIGSGYIGGFQVRIGGTGGSAPQAMMSAADVTLPSSRTQAVSVLFSDDQAIDATTITSGSVFAVGPNGTELPLTLYDINYGQDTPEVSATFGIAAPGGSWDPADNGVYRIAVRDGTVRDTFGNFIPGFTTDIPAGQELGAFGVAITADTEPPAPQAVAQVSDLTAPGPYHTFSVTYSAASAIDASSLGNTNVFVTDGAGFAELAELVSVDTPGDGTPRTATYRIAGPGGAWGMSANGTYDIYTTADYEATVRTVEGSSVPSRLLATFTVNIVLAPEIEVAGNGITILSGDASPAAADGTDFGVVVVGQQLVRTFTVRNVGTAPLTVTGVAAAGTHAADFTVTSPTSPIPAGGSAAFTVTFRPGAGGARAGLVRVSSDDADEPAYEFAVGGQGLVLAPDIDLQLDGGTNFGEATFGLGSVVRTYTVRNVGNQPLTVTAVETLGSAAADFTVTQPASPVPVGGSATFTVTFRPLNEGRRDATVRVVSDDPDEGTLFFAITGTGRLLPVTDTDQTANAVTEGSATGTGTGLTVNWPGQGGISYRLTDDAGGRFAINPASGAVTVANGSLLDYEGAASHVIRAEATDGTRVASATFTVAVANAAPAQLRDADPASSRVWSTAAMGETVGITALAIEPGGGLTYRLADDAGGRFAIDPASGVVTVAAALSGTMTYPLVIEATDGTAAVQGSYSVLVAAAPEAVYLAFRQPEVLTNSDGSTLEVTPQDIARLTFGDDGAYRYSLYLHGRDVGLTTAGEGIDAFTFLPDGGLLISTVWRASVRTDYRLRSTGRGSTIIAAGHDLLRFRPTQVGTDTRGTWSVYLDGSDIGLTTVAENIDAVEWHAGDLLYSTAGQVRVYGLIAEAEDVVLFRPRRLGPNSLGRSWMYLDGSDVGLSGLNVDGLFMPDDGPARMNLSVNGNYSLPGAAGTAADVFEFLAELTGTNSAGTFAPGMPVPASALGIPSAANVDDFYLGPAPVAFPGEETTIPPREVAQYATHLLGYSSQYGPYQWSAYQALGAPDTFGYGAYPTTWSPYSLNGTMEFLAVGFATPVYAESVVVRETYGNGFVRAIDVIDEFGWSHTVWSGYDPSLPGSVVDFRATWARTPYRVVGVRVWVDTNQNFSTWEEIDSVQLWGVEG